MESEKVKEIKKALECMSGLCKDSLSNICFECEIDKKFDEESACKEALTLINELESENESLTKQYVDWKDLYYENTKRVKKLKDRIAELEKELTNDMFFYKDGICYPINCQGALKQFAERLKEKLKARHEANRLLLMPVRDVVLSTIEGLLEDIDKTLKEIINE